ncbi:MAG TPA: DUF488 domain-containing protein [Hyphomicrobium sp.]|nr:DUF488 domain-containing protein [Hyphomicrobium sp.]
MTTKSKSKNGDGVGEKVSIKRAYDAPARGDGMRVLVDALWPRGVRKDDAKIDVWLKEIAPSTELRSWFHHDPERWAEFRSRYRSELSKNADAVAELKHLARRGHLTLVYAARDVEHNNAVVLQGLLNRSR